VKRLIVLLIVVAGGLAAAAFAVPSNAASVNGVSISQQQLNSDLAAIANSPGYQCFLNAEQAVGSGGQSALPTIDGAGQAVGSGSHPTITAAFAANYLDTAIGRQLILELAAKDHLQVTSADLAAARTTLKAQITGVLQEVSSTAFACKGSTPTANEVLASMPSSFVAQTVRFDATVSVFEEQAAGVGSSTADLQRYYGAHASEFDQACFTVAEYTSQSDATAALASVAAGTPFAQVAAQVAGGGPQGCQILYGVATALPAGSNLETLPLNTVSQPIAENSTYLLVEITKRTPSPFAKARTSVEAAVQNAGASKARTRINAAEKTAAISVDQRYGTWVQSQAQILAPSTPIPGDVLNPAVNGTATAASSTTTPATGQTP
jgi:hypothetical protein